MIFISHLLPKLNLLNLMISGTENHFPSLCAKNEKNNNRVNSRENISEVFLRKYVTLKSSKSTRSPFWPHMIFVNFLFYWWQSQRRGGGTLGDSLIHQSLISHLWSKIRKTGCSHCLNFCQTKHEELGEAFKPLIEHNNKKNRSVCFIT